MEMKKVKMFQQLNNTGKPEDPNSDEDIIGSIDLTNPENLDIKKASLELTTRSPQYPLVNPIKDQSMQEMTFEEWKTAIDKLRDEGIESVILTGGEPTIRADFHAILQYCIQAFDNVTVQTTGATRKNLSDFDCSVSIPIEYWNDLLNNEMRRMTDPDKWYYNKEMNMEKENDEGNLVEYQGVLERIEPTVCKICGKDLEEKDVAINHVKEEHRKQAISTFNADEEAEVDSWSEMEKSDNYDNGIFIERPDPIPIPENENAKRIAQSKAEELAEKNEDEDKDIDIVIQSNIYSDNNIFKLIKYCQIIGADLALKPIYPVSKNPKLNEQIPAPDRLREVMQAVRSLNEVVDIDVWIESPMYKAWKFEYNIKNNTKTEIHKDTYINWWKRGRVSDVGINSIHIAANGEIMGSRYIRDEKLKIGQILTHSWDDIYENLGKFNNAISSSEDLRPVKSLNLKTRSIAGDPNIYLNSDKP